MREQARKRKVPHLRFGRDQIKFRRTDVVALMDLAAITPIPIARAEPEQTDDETSGTSELMTEAAAAYRMAKAAGPAGAGCATGSPETAARLRPRRTAV